MIAAAETCFRELGYRGTTIQRVAERAEVPVGNVYYYFRTKEHFAAAVIETRRAHFEAHVQAHMDKSDALESFVRWQLSRPNQIANHGLELYTLVRDLIAEGVSVDVIAAARKLAEDHERYLRELVQASIVDEESPKRAERLADWLCQNIVGIATRSHLLGVADAQDRCEDLLAQLRARMR